MTGRAGAELKPTAGNGRPGKLSAVSGKHGRVRGNEPARRPRNTADRIDRTVDRTVAASAKSFGTCPYRLSSVCKPPICYRGLFPV
ncbi:hypothetical protein [Paenibacillus chitinolyticus]|uniref:hypothetical protein n=1 Tax=Paenibacillus chitinolyticus TaxID=79263 RepID=UPI0036497C14